MEFGEEQREILYRAWLLNRAAGAGQVLEDGVIPDAHRLWEKGWLERRFEDNGDLSWWWTEAAEIAFNLASLTRSKPAGLN
jgi:hypothetical protein